MVGTTSACAENTVFLGRVFEGQRNYLRVRGEYRLVLVTLRICRELPPRARRIQSLQVNIPVGNGTTSACAENTTSPPRRLMIPRNYLRVRGEYCRRFYPKANSQELPPRARRILPPEMIPSDWTGTTSACAENTHTAPNPAHNHWNYLRVRGEYPK